MTAFFLHPKFWLPLLMLLCLELAFRLGIWESLAEPESHAGSSIALKQALDRLDQEPAQVILLGDSQVQYGLDHRTLYEQARANGVVLANMSLPGTHLATLKALSSWAVDRLPQLETVIIGLTPAALARVGNGDYEIGIVEPFRNAADYFTLVNHFPPRLGVPASWGSVSSLASYREDITGLLGNPKRRLQRLIARNLEDPRRRIRFTNPSLGNLCEFQLASRASCLGELADLRSRGRGDEAAARSFASWCEAGSVTPDTEERQLAFSAWREYLEGLAANHRLVIVLMPGHGLLQELASQLPAKAAVENVLEPLASSGLIQIIDLRSSLSAEATQECENYRDLVHANRQGMHRLTRLLTKQLSLP